MKVVVVVLLLLLRDGGGRMRMIVINGRRCEMRIGTEAGGNDTAAHDPVVVSYRWGKCAR
jgi:hypothetical protein